MSKVILVDFGASRIKAALVDSDSSRFIDYFECISPSANVAKFQENKFEIEPEKYWNALENTAGLLIKKYPQYKINTLWICSEMHGFLLADESGKPITGYISWKDQRANHDEILDSRKKSTLDLLNLELKNFYKKTGMYLKPGFPIVTLSSGMNRNTIPQLISFKENKNIKFLTLVDWLLIRGGVKNAVSNITLAAATGLFDIVKKEWSKDLLIASGIGLENFIFPNVIEDIALPLGEIFLSNQLIRIYGGVGDFQAAIYGANFPEDAGTIINLGTGSQVAINVNSKNLFSGPEIRPLILGGYAKVITHIPCGRALDVIASFIDDVAEISGGKKIFWSLWSQLSKEDVIESRAISNLNLFDAAWKRKNFSNYSGWLGLDEGFSSVSQVISGVAKSWLNQYSDALSNLDPFYLNSTTLVTGTLAEKSNFFINYLNFLEPKRTFKLIKNNINEENTLKGLLKLSKIYK